MSKDKTAKTVDRKIYELLSNDLIYPIPTIEDYQKYVYVSLEDTRSFDDVREHLLDKIDEYKEADDVEKEIIWYEIIMELELLYIKAKRNRGSADIHIVGFISALGRIILSSLWVH